MTQGRRPSAAGRGGHAQIGNIQPLTWAENAPIGS
jgi:hypothetical protein